MKKKTIIVSDYSGIGERIYTITNYCIFFAKLQFYFKGYNTFRIPFIWIYKMQHAIGWFPYRWAWTNVSFEYLDPELDQITHFSPHGD